MSLTVGALVDRLELQTVPLTRNVGLDRPITWAHVCELADPWRWLSEGALVMTTGLALPESEADQIEYFTGMFRGGIAAVTFDERMPKHQLTPGAIAHAMEIGFPVLQTAYDVRFITIAMTVAETLQRGHQSRLRETEQLYGSLLLSELCDGSVPTAPATRLVSTYAMESPFLLAVSQPGDVQRAFEESYELFTRASKQVLAAIKDEQLLIFAEATQSEELLADLAKRHGSFGVSAEFAQIDDLPHALGQARSALIRNQQRGSVLRFNEQEPSSLFLPNEMGQLRRIARQVLGPLRTYDAQRGTSLTQTLMVFLEENRSWTRAAERLYVHRQTLIARISRIEKIINRDLSSMEDTAECWLAIQAAIGCGELEPFTPGAAGAVGAADAE